ncbi:hypothetical protein HHK36_015952 [Tetracentron sinense]|uniref:C2 domain-containing protein n=1 Tax=Tetracentron sinense TaxID=13715 RepID=A0A834Z664_TETSI|nr:hypothetical protein HHK36_015952 [Tetracentron sinense]
MGNCCSDDATGRSAVSGTAASQSNPPAGNNDAVDHFLKSRGYHGLFTQVEDAKEYFITVCIKLARSGCVLQGLASWTCTGSGLDFFLLEYTCNGKVVPSLPVFSLEVFSISAEDKDVSAGEIEPILKYLKAIEGQGLKAMKAKRYSVISDESCAEKIQRWKAVQKKNLAMKRNPMAVVYVKGRDGALEELGRTEVVLVSLDPMWITKHAVTYHFDVVQTLVIRVYDVDTQFHNVPVKLLKLDDQQLLGEANCALSEIITKPTRSLTLSLIRSEESSRSTRPLNLGELTVCTEECVSSKNMTEMVLWCSDLEYRDLFSKSDHFLVISKTMESGIPIPICKTEVKKDDLNPAWRPLFLTSQQIGSKA